MKDRICQSNLQRWRLCYCHQSRYKDANDPNRDSQPKQGSCLIKEVEQTILSKSINIVEILNKDVKFHLNGKTYTSSPFEQYNLGGKCRKQAQGANSI